VNTFIEVDTKPVNDHKQKILDDLKSKGELIDPLCERKVISQDFSIESTKDLPTHGFNQEVPTCWILEGLVMYLEKEAAYQLYNEISDLSVAGSYFILNFLAFNPACKPEEVDQIMIEKGWTLESRAFFGDENFNYGRYPGKTPST
jgi:O-methyltransferase involved in polyketide biosynthesis